jgi:hypothetical protein
MAKTPTIVKEIQLTPKRELDYSYQKNISYSQYTMWKKCPKQWALQYRDGHKIYTPSIHTVFGKALHEAFQHYIKVMYEKSAVAANKEDINKIFEDQFETHFINEHKKAKEIRTNYKKSDIDEFLKDGFEILNHLKKNRGKYFSKRGWHLVGIETPILIPPIKYNPNVLFMGFLDIVMYNENSKKFKIIDIKTSTNGWNDYAKKDEEKQFQLILYKKFFAEQFEVDIEDIDIEFFITRRKVYEGGDYPQKRFQVLSKNDIPSGKIKTNRAIKAIEEFMSECFVKNEYSTKEMIPNPSKWNCKFCPYSYKGKGKKFCGKGEQF